jgi:hypothetical protein
MICNHKDLGARRWNLRKQQTRSGQELTGALGSGAQTNR